MESNSNEIESFEDLCKELTPEKLNEMKKENLEKLKKISVEFQLGYYIGEYIVLRYLPTLSIDMLTSRKIISVNSDEFRKYNDLDDAWYEKCKLKENNDGEWKALMDFRKEMKNKYLPKKLECYVNYINVENMSEVKKGIMSSLWNCDMSHYKCGEENDIEIIVDENLLFTKIVLTLADD